MKITRTVWLMIALVLAVGLALAAVSVSETSETGLIDAQVSVEATSGVGHLDTASPVMTLFTLNGNNQ